MGPEYFVIQKMSSSNNVRQNQCSLAAAQQGCEKDVSPQISKNGTKSILQMQMTEKIAKMPKIIFINAFFTSSKNDTDFFPT